MHTTKKILITSALMVGLVAPTVSSIAFGDHSPASVAVAATSTSDLSNGSGGSYTDRTFINYTAAGKTGQYHVYASGIDTSKPVGVVFQFHGDGGYEFKNPSYKLPGLNKQAKGQNMIFVSMKAPNTQNVWWNDMENNGEYARALIQNEVLGKYNIDKSRAWMVGYSGGAQFISQEMMEEHSDLFTGGGAVMFGGGAAPYSFDVAPTQNMKDNYQMTWHTGLLDGMDNSDPGWSALASAQKGSAFYKNAGFKNVDLQTPAGIDHFNYDEPKTFGIELSKWAATHPLTAAPAPTTPAPSPEPTAPTTPAPTTDPLTPTPTPTTDPLTPAPTPTEETVAAPKVVSSEVTYTDTGAVLNAKVENAAGKLLTFRTSAYQMNGQTGFYNQAYADADGNVSMSISSFTNTDTRYWQLEDGGGYYTHGNVLASGSVSKPVEPAPAPVKNPSTILDARVKEQNVTFTDSGAVIKAKTSLSRGTKVLFRASASELGGQTGFYEYGYVDRYGNVELQIRDFNHQDTRHWQLELGGGYSYYGKVLAEGSVSR